MRLLKRLYELLIKIVSVKGLVFIMATLLLAFDGLDSWVWFFVAILLVSARLLEKIFTKKE